MSRPGAVGRFADDVGKHRPCVVILVAEAEASHIIDYGTSTAGRDYPHIVIRPNEVSGRSLQLTQDTYFYKPNIVAVPAARVKVFPNRACAAMTLIQLRALAGLD